MNKTTTILVLCLLFSSASLHAQNTKSILKTGRVDRFFTCTLGEMMDTLSAQFNIPVFYDKARMENTHIANHFFNEKLEDVIKYACKLNKLQFWVETDGTLYILERPDDLPRLKKMAILERLQSAPAPRLLAKPAGLPTRSNFPISGKVTDGKTGEALAGAVVRVRNLPLRAVTNTSGNYYLLNVPSDTVALDVSYIGYQPDAVRLNSRLVDSLVTFTLFPILNSMAEVTITGKKSGIMNTDSKKVSVLQLSPAALDKVPNIGERDIMRTFQLMPGISATNESSSGVYVRGGTPDQNLVTFDGFTVYQVDHLYGFFSAFNSNTIRDVELFKGGFSAKYGGRLSSVTEIRGKDGNKKELNFGGDLSLLSTNAYVESPLGSKASALVAVRRSYQGPLYNKIFDKFNSSTASSNTMTGPGGGRGPGGGMPGGFSAQQTTPSSYFYDVNGKFVFNPSEGNTLALTFYNGSDYLDNSRDMDLPSFTGGSTSTLNIVDNMTSGNTGASLKWTSSPGKQLYGSTSLSYSGFYSDRDRTTKGSFTDNDSTVSINNGSLENNRLRDLSIKSDWEMPVTSGIKLLAGGFGSRLNIDYTLLQNGSDTTVDQHTAGTIAGGYTEAEIDLGSKLHLRPGARYTYFSPTGKLYTEPRFSIRYELTDKLNLKGATGRFYQFSNRVIREDVTGGDRNFWVLANGNGIPVGAANHFIAGFNYETDGFLLDVEGYYKNLTGLTEYSIRTTGGGGGGGIGGGPFGATQTASSVIENFYTGSGYAKGVETLLQKKTGAYTGWISYTLAEAKNKFPAYGSGYISSAQDITHEFKSVNMYHLQRWSFAAVFIFSTGHPYTAPLGSYTVQTLDGRTINYLSISEKNGERLPSYHRLDVSATYDFLKVNGGKSGSIGLSLFNLYNHQNTWYNEYYIRSNQVYTTTVKYLGFTPNITLSLKWK